MADSIQKKLTRVRPPRVQITYDVEIGDAIEQKEIPFVAGVLGDFSGQPEKPLAPVKERKFIEIDRDNFDAILEGMKPRLAFQVENKIEEDSDTKIGVELNFKSLDDFHPERIAEQVEPIRKLVEARKKLYNLLSKLDGNDKLNELLQDIISNTDKLEAIGKASMGKNDTDPGDTGNDRNTAEGDKQE
jgi:type VI secretion system protein ImpB